MSDASLAALLSLSRATLTSPTHFCFQKRKLGLREVKNAARCHTAWVQFTRVGSGWYGRGPTAGQVTHRTSPELLPGYCCELGPSTGQLQPLSPA